MTTDVVIPTLGVITDSNTHLNAVALPIGEVARLAGVTIPTARNWERDGKIDSFRTPGGQRRFPMSEVNRVLAAPAPLTPDSTGTSLRAGAEVAS